MGAFDIRHCTADIGVISSPRLYFRARHGYRRFEARLLPRVILGIRHVTCAPFGHA